MVNFGWEYVWHCHILSHEEMDMMRPMSLAVARSIPATPALAANGTPGSPIDLTWTDATPAGDPGTLGNPANEIGFRVERAEVTSESVVGLYSVVATASANQTTYRDDTTIDGRAYRYIVYAFNAASPGVPSNAVTVTPPLFFDSNVITPMAGRGGSITPGTPQGVTAGNDSPVFTITPDPGYSILDVVIDGVSVGTGSSHQFFNVTGDHTLWAFFAKDDFTITPSAGDHGNITPNWRQRVDRGNNSTTFRFHANPGYHVADVKIDGVSVGVVPSYTFTNVLADHTIDVRFEVNVYTINTSAGVGGSITPNVAQKIPFLANSPVFQIKPARGYYITNVIVDGVSRGPVTSHQFLKVRADHSIQAQFALKAVKRRGSGTLTNALKTAGYSYPGWKGVKHVVIASGDTGAKNQFEAATAAGLAGAYKAPLLLVSPKTLRADIRRALVAMPDGVRVHIVGGTSGVSNSVRTAIAKTPGVASVDRVYGRDRYLTAIAVAKRMKAVMGSSFPGTAILVSAELPSRTSDAVAASPVSARKGFPILYVKKNWVPVVTSAALFDLGLKKRYVIGGSASVSERARSAAGVSPGDRIWGPDKYGTATAIASRAKAEGWLTGERFGAASSAASANWSGAYLATRNAPLLYVSPTSAPTRTSAYLASRKATTIGGYVFGPKALVSESVRTRLLNTIK